MAEVLGLGISHYPLLSSEDANMAGLLRGRLLDPGVPESAKQVSTWPEAMQREWGGDEGRTAAAYHRAAMLRGIRRVRQALDEFDPDVVLIWGDDQYENFREDVIPPFCVMAYDDMILHPWAQASESAMFSGNEDEWGGGRPNIWGERGDFAFPVPGARIQAKRLASALIDSDFDISYAYRPLHHPGLPHAFLNAILYLDYDRLGWRWPVIPFQINCYGRQVISYRGFVSQMGDRGRELDPPSPSPRRCFDMGAAVGRILRDSDQRVALIASSSWSHAFLCDKTWRMQPDIVSDRAFYDAMVAGDYARWREAPLDAIEESGQQELLNWFALMGAMDALGQRCSWAEFVETHVFNSSKVAAIFAPSRG